MELTKISFLYTGRNHAFNLVTILSGPGAKLKAKSIFNQACCYFVSLQSCHARSAA